MRRSATNGALLISDVGSGIHRQYLQAKYFTTAITLKEMGAKNYCQGADSLYTYCAGENRTDVVIYPERDMAIKLAHSFVHNIMNQIDLSSEYSIVEILAPAEFVNKSLRQMDLRTKKNIAVIAIKHDEEISLPPDPDQIIKARDILVIAGENKYINNVADLDL